MLFLNSRLGLWLARHRVIFPHVLVHTTKSKQGMNGWRSPSNGEQSAIYSPSVVNHVMPATPYDSRITRPRSKTIFNSVMLLLEKLNTTRF